MPYTNLKDKRVRVVHKGYPWNHTLITNGMLESMKTLRDEGGICTDRDGVARTEEDRRAFHRAIEILEIISSDRVKNFDEEDKLYDELWLILGKELRAWWN